MNPQEINEWVSAAKLAFAAAEIVMDAVEEPAHPFQSTTLAVYTPRLSTSTTSVAEVAPLTASPFLNH